MKLQAQLIKTGQKVIIRGEALKVTRTQKHPQSDNCVILHFKDQSIKAVCFDNLHEVELA